MTVELTYQGGSQKSICDSVLERPMACLITLALFLEWVPGYFSNVDGTVFSFTKFIVLPGIAFDTIYNFRKYAARPMAAIVVLLLVGCVAGVGAGVFAGTVPLERWGAVAATVPITLYYARPRSVRVLNDIIRCMFASSLTVSLFLVLAWMGFLSPTEYSQDEGIVRISVGVSWSELPLFLTVPGAVVGGLLLVDRRSKWHPASTSPFFVAALVTALAGSAASGQRTATIVFVISTILATLLYYARPKLKSLIALAVVLGLISVILWQVAATSIADTFLKRSFSRETGYLDSGINERSLHWTTFLDDLFRDLAISPPGLDQFVSQVGTIPHLILAEAYYEGGVLFLLAIVMLLLLGLSRATKACWLNRQSKTFSVRVAILVMLIGFLISLGFHPGLRTRLFYVVLGLCLGAPGIYDEVFCQLKGINRAKVQADI